MLDLVRAGTVAAVAFGVARLVAHLIDLFGIDYRLGMASVLQSGPYAHSPGLSLMASLLLPVDLFGIYAHGGERRGRLGLAGFALAFLGAPNGGRERLGERIHGAGGGRGGPRNLLL